MAKLGPVIFLHRSLSLYWNLYITLKCAFCQLYYSLRINIYIGLLIILPKYFSMWNSRPSNISIQVKHHWPMLSCFFWFPLFLLISIGLTVTINISAFFFNLGDSRINPGTFGVAHPSCCGGVSGSLMTLSCSKSDSSSASQSGSLTFGLLKSLLQ